MNELRIWRHSSMVIGMKQIFKRVKIEEEVGRVIVLGRKNQEQIKIKIEKNYVLKF